MFNEGVAPICITAPAVADLASHAEWANEFLVFEQRRAEEIVDDRDGDWTKDFMSSQHGAGIIMK